MTARPGALGRWGCSLVGGALVMVSCCPESQCPASLNLERARAATVMLDQRCSAVVAGTDSIWTAAHCLGEGQKTTYWHQGESRSRSARLVANYPDRDLTQLLTDEVWPRMPVRRWPALGEVAFVVHHRCSGGWCVASAPVVYTGSLWNEGALDWAPPSGASGSGVWGQDGALLGVIQTLGTESGRAYFAIVADLPVRSPEP